MVRDRKKVVWFEGMTLDPHHFQQWDRHQQGVLNTRVRAVAPHGWGLSHVAFDEERLANGELALLACAGVMPDGLIFDVPDTSPPPDARSVQEHFPATEERLVVHLAIPAERKNGRNVLMQDGGTGQRETRFVAESVSVIDENTGAGERPIEVARTNVHLRFASEPQQGYSTLPVAEVVRTAGGFALEERFVPPSLHVGASAHLSGLTRRVLELLVAKSSSLTERQRDASTQRELSPADVKAMHLLGTVNTYIPLLNNIYEGGKHHPQVLFERLLGLAGQLSAYTGEASVRPRDFPSYDHAALTACFARLEDILLELLGEATPSSNYERVPLERERESLLVATVRGDLLDEAQLFLVTRSAHHSEEQLTETLPNMLRIASPGTIDAVLQSYTRALAVEATRRLPTGMPVDNQATYFRIEKRGPFWESVREEGGIAIFLPSEFTNVDMTLIAAT